METNNKKCPYCNSKLKISKLNCPKCHEKIFTKETRIKSIPLSEYLYKSLILIGILTPIWLSPLFYADYSLYIKLFVALFLFSLIFILLFLCGFIYLKVSHNIHFLISSESIQFIKKKVIIIEFLWKDINNIELIKEKYHSRSPNSANYDNGYNLKFYLSKEVRSVRPWCLKFDRDKPPEKMADLIREFSKHLKKEIFELEDLEKSKSEDICSKEKKNFFDDLEKSPLFDISIQ